MKRILYILIISIIVLVGCNGGGEATNAASNSAQQSDKQDVAQIVFAAANEDTTVVHTDGVECQISVVLYYAMGGAVADSVNAAILNCGLIPKNCLGSCKAEDMPNRANDIAKHYVKSFLENDLDLPYDNPQLFFDAYSKMFFGRDSIICYEYGYDSFMGGVRNNYQMVSLNFDLKTGKLIKLKDFIKPEAEGKITELIVADVIKQFDDCTSLQDLQDNHLIFSEFDPYVPENFVIGKDFVEFIYQHEEIAPYAVGFVTAKIPYKDLEGCLR